jgi:serine/threonine protein phosphatase PrpC
MAVGLKEGRCACCACLQFTLQPGDVVICASDGLFDNMWEEQVSEEGQENNLSSVFG